MEKRKEYFKSLNLNNRIKLPSFISDLRIVFTSFSQSLCDEQLKAFSQMMNKVNVISYKQNNNNINSDIKCKNKPKRNEIYSFRDICPYPAF